MFGWCNDALDALTNLLGPGVLDTLTDQLGCLKFTTAFSGIDAPGMAFRVLESTLSERLGRSGAPSTVRHLNAVEWDAECQRELRCCAHPPEHLTADVEGFFVHAVTQRIAKAERAGQRLSLDAFLPTICSGLSVRKTVPCLLHPHVDGGCTFAGGDIHVAGTPCVSFSPMGGNEKEGGTDIKHFSAWAAQRLKVQEPVIVHENSDRFTVATLEKVFGKRYAVQSIVLCPTELGWPVRRRRRWSVLIHRSRLLQATVSLENCVSLFHRACACSFTEFFVATEEELLWELGWMWGRPKAGSKLANAPLPTDPTSEHFWEALTEAERTNLASYEAEGKDKVCMLNQMHAKGRGVTSGATTLHTLIKNTGVQWNSLLGRPMAAFPEMLLAQGFPVRPGLVAGVTSDFANYCSRATDAKDRRLKRTAVAGQVGNSMNVNCAGVVLLWAILAAEPAKRMGLVDLLRGRRAGAAGA